MTRHALVPGLLCLTLAAGPTMGSGASPAGLQEGKPASVEVDPPELELEVGETIQLRAVVKDARGTVLPGAQVVFFSGSRSSVGVTPSGMVEAYQPGEHELTALSPAESFEGEPDSYSRRDSGIRTTIKVKVPVPPLARLDFVDLPATLYAGTTVPVEVSATDVSGTTRGDIESVLSVSDTSVARAGVGEVTALRPGKVKLEARAERVTANFELTVRENPVRSLELEASREEGRTGDVIHFETTAKDERGRPVADAPVTYTLLARPGPQSRRNRRCWSTGTSGRRWSLRGRAAGNLHRDCDVGPALSPTERSDHPARRSAKDRAGRPCARRGPGDLGSLGLGGGRRPRLRGSRHLERGGSRVFLRRHRPLQHAAHRYHPSRRPDRQRRKGLRGRTHLRHQPRGGFEPAQRHRDSRRERSSKRAHSLSVRRAVDRRRAQRVHSRQTRLRGQ